MTTDCVYVFSNPSMPGIVKIGRTSNGEKGVEKRRKELSRGTGVAKPFICEGFVFTRNGKALEQKAHEALRDRRVNHKREFFKVSKGRAIGLLEELRSLVSDLNIPQQLACCNNRIEPVGRFQPP